jgi:hypothetical protein
MWLTAKCIADLSKKNLPEVDVSPFGTTSIRPLPPPSPGSGRPRSILSKTAIWVLIVIGAVLAIALAVGLVHGNPVQ